MQIGWGVSRLQHPKSAISYTFYNDPYNSSALPCRLWFEGCRRIDGAEVSEFQTDGTDTEKARDAKLELTAGLKNWWAELQIIGQICGFDRGVPLFNTLVRGEPLNSDEPLNWRPRNIATKKLETSLGRDVQSAFRSLEPFRRGSRVWRTDRRTDRTVDSNRIAQSNDASENACRYQFNVCIEWISSFIF